MKYTFVKQHDATDCAAACLAMICLHYKKETTITKLRDLMGTDLKGTNLVGLSKCAKDLGFDTQPVRVDREGFSSKFSLPCIANIITKEGLTHFVVIFKITNKYVVIGDPAKDFIRITIDEFYKEFTGVLLLLIPNSNFNLEKDYTHNLYSRFIKLLTPHKKLFIYSVIASIILTVLGIVSSLFNKIIMDEILPYKLKNTLLLIVIVFVAITFIQALVGFIRQWILLYLSQKIDIPLLLGYFEHIYKLPMKFFSTRKTGDIITRFSDAFTIKDVFTSIALTVVMDISMAIVTGIILWKMNISLFGIILIITIVNIMLVFIFKQPYKKINQEQMQQTSVLNSQIIEGLRAVETIKGNANEKSELENIEKEYIRSLRISLKEGMLSNVQSSISNVIKSAGNMFLMYFGIMQVINVNLTLGSLMAFLTMAGFFMEPVNRLVGLQLQLQEANISMQRLTEILDYETEQNDENKTVLSEITGDINIKNITFRYGNRKPVFNNLSFTIPKGKKVALVGSSGSGKSTLAKLILKYYEPENGNILIDDIDINDYSNDSIRQMISYVPQSIELFSQSIYDNIRITKSNATLDEVKEAAKKANAHDFIQKLPLQYQTYLEEAGAGLSGGEKQRIAIARAFLKNSDFYILDESTSSLDFSTENVIFDMIYNKLNTKTMLIIAHRLATIKNCDVIIVLDNGEIIERGTHEELLEKQGQYYNLWELQQGNFISKKIEDTNVSNYVEPDDNELSYF
ncbi:MAG: peptidase domain-containing ABC transporter [Oscillospiraceae bacterium]|jgi:ATP-binding cassette subfamily B protein|nr:peptidase domain-containing ABC transporter [Oscillospiraceae bacterium]